MPNRINRLLHRELSADLKDLDSVIFVGYVGLTAEQSFEMRRELRAENIMFKVVRNRVTRLIFDENGAEGSASVISGPTAVMGGAEDVVALAKIATGIAKKYKTGSDAVLEIKGGVVDGEVIDAAQVVALSKLPGKEELRGQVVGTLAAPITGLYRVLEGNSQNLLYALKDRISKLESA